MKFAAAFAAVFFLCVPVVSFAERADTGDGQSVIDEARKFMKRPIEEEGGSADPEQAFARFQSDKHEKFVGMLERYLAQFIEKAKGTNSAMMKELLKFAESIKGSLGSYRTKLDRMRDMIDVAREANGLPVEARKD